jgi:hypothetical protein
MKKKLLIVVFFSLLLAGCALSYRKIEFFFTAKDKDEVFLKAPVEIVSGYKLAQFKHGSQNFVIISPSKLAPDGIYDSDFTYAVDLIGWTNDFIVGEIHSAKISWFLIVISSEQVYDCIDFPEETIMCNSYERFVSIEQQLGVPTNIELRDVEQVYTELSKIK